MVLDTWALKVLEVAYKIRLSSDNTVKEPLPRAVLLNDLHTS